MKTLRIIISCFSILLLLGSCTDTLDPATPGDDDVEKFLGTWSVSDLPARLNYSVSIKRNPADANQVILQNFADLGGQAIGLVVNKTIVIDQQEIGSNYQSEGTGEYINSDELYFEFFLDDGIDKELRKATYSK